MDAGDEIYLNGVARLFKKTTKQQESVMRIRHILIAIICIVVLASCTQRTLKSYFKTSMKKDWAISLRVTGVGGAANMKVDTGPMARCRNSDKGCMVFESKEKGSITFDMKGADTGWHITQLKICKGKTPPVPLTLPCPLGANAFDFYIDIGGDVTIPNLQTGEINWSYADAIKTFEINDRNLLEENYYYMLIACDGPLVADNCITADPPVDNKGVK
jgi:hypothetical protein